MNCNYDFIENLIGIQGIEVLYTNVNVSTYQVFATSTHNFAVCPRCKLITQNVHDRRFQHYRHLPIWGMDTIIIFEKKRYVCDCDPEHPFDEPIEFNRKYQRQTISYEKYVFTLTHKNTVKNVSEVVGISQPKCQRIYNFYAESVLEAKESEELKLLGIDDIARKNALKIWCFQGA